MAKRNLNRTAAQVGAALGHFAARIDALKKQREAIAADLRKYVATAEGMLEALGEQAQRGRRAVTAAADAFAHGAASRPGRPKGYKQTDEARRKMRLAWKRRKAAKAAEKKGERAKR